MGETAKFLIGKLFPDAAALGRGGWTIGHFMPEGDPRKFAGFEVKAEIIEPGEYTHALKIDGAYDFNVLMDGEAVAVIDGEEHLVMAQLTDTSSWVYTVVQPGVPNAFPRHARTRLIMLCVKSPSAPGLKQVI